MEEYINPALSSNKLMLSLINDMLDFVQSEEGKMKFFFQTFDILDLVKEVCQMISFKAR